MLWTLASQSSCLPSSRRSSHRSRVNVSMYASILILAATIPPIAAECRMCSEVFDLPLPVLCDVCYPVLVTTSPLLCAVRADGRRWKRCLFVILLVVVTVLFQHFILFYQLEKKPSSLLLSSSSPKRGVLVATLLCVYLHILMLPPSQCRQVPSLCHPSSNQPALRPTRLILFEGIFKLLTSAKNNTSLELVCAAWWWQRLKSKPPPWRCVIFTGPGSPSLDLSRPAVRTVDCEWCVQFFLRRVYVCVLLTVALCHVVVASRSISNVSIMLHGFSL
eukprot:scpid18093/ scgid15214/ 